MIILAFATDGERQRALRCLPPQNGTLESVTLDGHVFVPVVVGIGPVAAALSIGGVLERHPHAAGIINLGICGSFDLSLRPLGAACVADAEIWPEYGVNPEDGAPFTFQMLPDLSLSPVNRLELAPKAATAALGLVLPPAWLHGHSLTVAGVSGTRERGHALRVRYEAATENMEGFALALAARRRGIPFLEVRTVSNAVGERDKRLWNFGLALQNLETVLPALTGRPCSP